jgi:hypothetical protein
MKVFEWWRRFFLNLGAVVIENTTEWKTVLKNCKFRAKGNLWQRNLSRCFRLLFRNVRIASHEVISQISCKLVPIYNGTFKSSMFQDNLLQIDPSVSLYNTKMSHQTFRTTVILIWSLHDIFLNTLVSPLKLYKFEMSSKQNLSI